MTKMTAVDSDIDLFIRQQKTKLANERQNLNMLEPPNYYKDTARRRWGPPVDLDTLKNIEKENYKKTWYELKGKYLEPSSSHRLEDPAMKLLPRGVLDTNALILNVQKEKEREEYEDVWRRYHGGQEPSPRGPGLINRAPINRIDGRISDPSDQRVSLGNISQRTQRQREREEYKQLWQQQHPEGREHWPFQSNSVNAQTLDIDKIIQEVKKEKQEEEKHLGIRNLLLGEGGSTKATLDRKAITRKAGVEKGFDVDEYKRLWEQQNAKREQGAPTLAPWSQKAVAGAKLDTDALIAEVTKEKFEEEQRQSLEAASKTAVGNNLHQREGSLFEDSQRNIENNISEAKQEANDYRKRWEAKNNKRSETQWPRHENVGVLIDEEDRLERMRKLREERKREYNDYLAKQRRIPTRERYNLTPEVDESEDFGLFHNLGMEDKKKQRVREPPNQLHQPGQNFNSGRQQRAYQGRPLREQTDEYKVSALEANESDTVKLQKIKERNDEYNQHVIAKSEKDKNRFAEKKPPPGDGGIYATIPGLRYSTSAQKREMAAERNREYNELLHKKAQNKNHRGVDAPFDGPKQAWSSPTYEEVLEQKRAQESIYRRANDIAHEASLHETERRMMELQRDLANNPIAYEPGASELVREQKEVLSRLKDLNLKNDKKTESVKFKPTDLELKNYQDVGMRGPPLDLGPTGRYGTGQLDGQLFGPRELDPRSEKLRKQEEYKRDLQQQMAEAAFARRQEKVEGLPVQMTGTLNPEPVHLIYGGRETNRKDPAVEAYHTKILDSLKKLDEISPLSNALLAPKQLNTERKTLGGFNLNPNLLPNTIKPAPAERPGAGGLLDLGFGPVLEPARLTSLDPPPGLQYQPSTYITANAVANPNNSVDEAYNFFASHNPLDPYLGAAPSGVGRAAEMGGDVPVPSLDLSRVGRDGDPTSRAHFKSQEAPASGMTFASDHERKHNQRQQQNVYREELEKQMMEKNIKKIREKEAQERYELKMEEEAKNYDPYGKGGGGAPMRDQYGNVITDLRQMRHDNNNRDTKFSPRGYSKDTVGQSGNMTRGAVSYRDDLIGPPPLQTTAEGETSFARGGHGIFGMPKTDAEKMQADKYKIDLKRQMEEKRAEEYRKKQLERLEEERQQKILEEQRLKMQREFEEEQRRIREKEEEAHRRNEEMIRAAEEKKRENERRKREAEDLRRQEQRDEREREIREQQRADEVQNRGKSPVIPTLRGKQKVNEDSNKVPSSPPVPAARTKAVSPLPYTQEFVPRTHSADVLNQLAHMRAQLQNERRRVQTMLNDQQDDVDIYDPRTAHRPGPVGFPKTDHDIFETAMNRNAVAVRRTPADKANQQAAEEFSALKHKSDSDSRKQFRKMFPDEPVTADALEVQQAALLREQEQRLRDRRAFDGTPPLPNRPTRDTRSSSSQLHSKSAFVELNGIGHFPDDFEDIPRRNDSARSRRRTQVSSSPRVRTPESRSAFGSQTSLNVDKLAKKNEDRLKKLRDMQGDDLSLYDPEDVLERFMSKQAHNRMYLEDVEVRSDTFSPKFGTPVG